jgi:RIO-like serine/threonine protein kinase
MAQALVVLLHHGVIHGDIEPKNIFITVDGSFKLGIAFFFILYSFTSR